MRSVSTCFTHKYSFFCCDIFSLSRMGAFSSKTSSHTTVLAMALSRRKRLWKKCFFFVAPNWAVEKMRNARAQRSQPLPLTTSSKPSFNTPHSPCCPFWPHSTIQMTWKKSVFCLGGHLLASMPSTSHLEKNCPPHQLKHFTKLRILVTQPPPLPQEKIESGLINPVPKKTLLSV